MSKLTDRRAARRAATTPPPAHLRRVSDVAALTGIPRRTLQRWASEGRIEAHKHGPRLWYINMDDAQRLAETLTPGPKPKPKT